MLSGRDLRRLLELRRRLRQEVLALRASRRRLLLQELVRVRRQRIPGPHPASQELSGGEVLREIKWLVNTLSLDEAEAGARALARLQRLPSRGAKRAGRSTAASRTTA